MNIGLTLIGQSLVFVVFVAFCMKYVWPHVKAAMTERQQAIAQGLEAAEAADKKLREAESGAESERAQAKREAAQIIEQARQRASQMVESARDEARAEGERMLEAARAEIGQEMNRARERLRQDVGALAIRGAEQVLEEQIDPERHERILDRLAAEL